MGDVTKLDMVDDVELLHLHSVISFLMFCKNFTCVFSAFSSLDHTFANWQLITPLSVPDFQWVHPTLNLSVLVTLTFQSGLLTRVLSKGLKS